MATPVAVFNAETDGIEIRLNARAARIIAQALQNYDPGAMGLPGLPWGESRNMVMETASRVRGDILAAVNAWKAAAAGEQS